MKQGEKNQSRLPNTKSTHIINAEYVYILHGRLMWPNHFNWFFFSSGPFLFYFSHLLKIRFEKPLNLFSFNISRTLVCNSLRFWYHLLWHSECKIQGSNLKIKGSIGVRTGVNIISFFFVIEDLRFEQNALSIFKKKN